MNDYAFVEDLIEETPSFNEYWKTCFSFFDEVPLNQEESDRFKSFAKKMFDVLRKDYCEVAESSLEKVKNEAWEEGKKTGRTFAINEMYGCLSDIKEKNKI